MNLPLWLAYSGAALAGCYALAILLRRKQSVTRWAFALGMLALGAEGALSGLVLQSDAPAELVARQSWRIVAMALLIGPWLLFSSRYARGQSRDRPLWKRMVVVAIAVVPPALALWFREDLVVAIRPSAFAFQAVLTLGWPALAIHFFLVLGSVLVLNNLERTYRAAVGTIRWRIKFVLLGLGLLFVVRLYTSSQALIVQSAEPGHVAIDAAALLAGLLVMLRSLVREGHFEMDVYPSPAVLRSSLTLLLVGIYLVLVGLISKVADLLGIKGILGVTTSIALLAIVALAIVLQSDRAKLILRRFVSRHFQRPFYDYRAVWRTFTEVSAAQVDPSSLCRVLTKQVADLFQALSVSIWLGGREGEGLVCVASSALPESSWAAVTPSVASAGVVCEYFRSQSDPVDFEVTREPWAETLRQCHPRVFPNGGNRAAVPLSHHGELVGVMVLGDRVGGAFYGTQDLDMLRCVADHAAANLVSLRLAERLLQAKELEAFQRMAAFFVHDLKNAASTLNLMLPNLPVHWDNPEFREDTLRGITKTVGHINTLIKRLSELRHDLKLNVREDDLNQVVTRALSGWKTVPGVELQTTLGPLPRSRFDPEQILTVLTNLVLNARDAIVEGGTRPGTVTVETRQNGPWLVVSVQDNGCGMNPRFLASSLFRPFQTTKKSGLGIGMFQSKMIVEAHGGRMVVESVEGKGTTFEVLLPLV